MKTKLRHCSAPGLARINKSVKVIISIVRNHCCNENFIRVGKDIVE